ncbi:MAG: EamA family transporter RarD [Sphingomonadales bacterium]|jgi:chloramphenicol-sensitive protein RarD
MSAPTTSYRAGLIAGLGAYVIWGLMPLYLRLLHGFAAGDVLSHRIAWSLLVLAGVLTASAGWGRLRDIFRQPKLVAMLFASAIAIGINWLVYTWAILAGHVLDTSLGYFINPLVNVIFGVTLLGERLSRMQWAAVALAAIGVAVQTIELGYLPWISLVLAASFGTYGLIRKTAGVDGLSGLAVETLLLAPIAFAWLATRPYNVSDMPLAQIALLAASGIITATPLLLFGRAARILPLSTLGLLQYLSPTLVFFQAVFLFGETLAPARLAAFGCIWVGLALYTLSLRRRSVLNPS